MSHPKHAISLFYLGSSCFLDTYGVQKSLELKNNIKKALISTIGCMSHPKKATKSSSSKSFDFLYLIMKQNCLHS